MKRSLAQDRIMAEYDLSEIAREIRSKNTLIAGLSYQIEEPASLDRSLFDSTSVEYEDRGASFLSCIRNARVRPADRDLPLRHFRRKAQQEAASLPR